MAKTHEMSKSSEYMCWRSMKKRCYSSSHNRYYRYGARGIKVCDRWLNSFENFYADMGPRPSKNHSIDRIDNNGNYEPGNCKWSTRKEQGKNTSLNKYIKYKGISKTISEWASIKNTTCTNLCKRLKRGWTVEETIEIPIGGRR